MKHLFNEILERPFNYNDFTTYKALLDKEEFSEHNFNEEVTNKLTSLLLTSDEYINLCGLQKIYNYCNMKVSTTATCNCAKNRIKKYWTTLWNLFHTITYLYPDNPTLLSQKRITIFFDNLGERISCPECRKHYSEYIKLHSINNIPNNRDSYVKWLVDLHNDVNKRLEKPTLSYDQVQKIHNNVLKTKIIDTYAIDAKKLFG